MKKVLLAGEGRNELGGWADPPPYQDPSRPGVLEALLHNAAPGRWQIGRAVRWKDIRKFRAGGHRGAETRAVLGLVQEARERRFDAVVFTRDRDGEKPEHEQREAEFLEGIRQAPALIRGAPDLIGGMAVQRLESWVLAMKGAPSTESMRNAEVDRRLSDAGVAGKDTDAMVAVARDADLDALPADARSLRAWIALARERL